MRTKALLLFAALPLAGCPQETQPAALPPPGLAGGAAAPHVPFGQQGQPAVAHGAASQPAAHGTDAPRAAPHPPMNTVPAPVEGNGAAAPANPHAAQANPHAAQANPHAAPTVIPGGGAAAVESASELTGTVSEAHHVKEYTYLRVKDANGNESWAAVLKDETIGVGAKVSLGKDIWMSDFQSPSMGRTFDRILFGRVLSKQ